MKLTKVLETSLYASNLEETALFYEEVLGLSVIARHPDRHVFFRLETSVLLLFQPKTTQDIQTYVSRNAIPCHGAMGDGHIAFAVGFDDLEKWRAYLVSRGIAIESEVEWPSGGYSLYIRDPAGNSVEFATPSLWGF
jgi:catechol 2,3-dioxygenase-like lactoylglutathione lyase family enzyme